MHLPEIVAVEAQLLFQYVDPILKFKNARYINDAHQGFKVLAKVKLQ